MINQTIKQTVLICTLLVAGIAGEAATTPSGGRTTLLVPVPVGVAWQDMAFLAAVPAATVVNNGSPSLVALEASGNLTPEVQDYLRRYRPDAVHILGGSATNLVVAGRTCQWIGAVSAEEAACKLSRAFWSTCRTVVICPEEDYEAALVASALAARLRASLLFVAAQKVSSSTAQEIRRLKAREILVVGRCGDVRPLRRMFVHITELAGARDVMAWTKKQNIPVRYLVALNPMDRDRTIVRKLSLAGALLAAGRDGLIAPLSYEVQWKVPFSGAEIPNDLPAGLSKSEPVSKAGRIVLNGREVKFSLNEKSKGQDLRVSFDRDGTGISEGPFATGDTVDLGGKRYVITLGTKNGDCNADVRLTWPSADQLVGDLRRYYEALGTAPEHLCLVGFPDAVPQAIVGWKDDVDELTSDLPYSNADDNQFAEIGVGRVIAENASFATLYASRVLTYASLLDPEWQGRACQSQWENTSEKILDNVGFDASFRHTEKNMKLLVPPTEGKKGKWAKTFEQDSLLARSAVVTHMDHSWWRELGHMFGWEADVLMAPVLVESGGCLTTTLDREPDFRSVIARLFRKGAVAFSGNSRQGCAPQELQRMEFWNGVLLHGETIGQAHRRSINSALVTIFDKKEDTSGDYGYQLRIRTLFGDPAFKLRVPCRPKSAPARVAVDGDTVTVHAPAQWWPVKIFVPEDWKLWKDKDLFVLRGTGTYALRHWCKEEYDQEETYMTAEFTTRRRVAKIEQVQKVPAPLGWTGSYYVDEHADGSRTYRWAVRMADFDQLKGHIINTVERLDYRMVYE